MKTFTKQDFRLWLRSHSPTAVVGKSGTSTHCIMSRFLREKLNDPTAVAYANESLIDDEYIRHQDWQREIVDIFDGNIVRVLHGSMTAEKALKLIFNEEWQPLNKEAVIAWFEKHLTRNFNKVTNDGWCGSCPFAVYFIEALGYPKARVDGMFWHPEGFEGVSSGGPLPSWAQEAICVIDRNAVRHIPLTGKDIVEILNAD